MVPKQTFWKSCLLAFLFMTYRFEATTEGKLVKNWKASEQTTAPGHYPQPYCSLTHVVLNGTDGVFYYRSDTNLHSQSCELADRVWDIQHVPELDNVDCIQTYRTGYVFLIYYWFMNSNYFHMTYDVFIPLYQEVYYNKKQSKKREGKIVFLPSTESSRLNKIKWDTNAFENEATFWNNIVQTPRTDFGDKEMIRSFIKFVKRGQGIEEVRPRQEKLGIISRSSRRLILNQRDLVQELNATIDTELVVLERMTFKEQVEAMQSFTILAGINGAGLINCLYLPVNAVCIQMVPYNASLNVVQFAQLLKARGPYLEWHNTNPALHTALPGDVYNNNPNTVVGVDDFTPTVKQAITLWRRSNPDYKDEL